MEYYKILDLESISYKDENGVECVEQWKDIPRFEGKYYVSNLGRLKNSKKILKPQKSGDYLKIELYKNNEYERWAVHRLVMLAFEGDSDLVVDHINNTTNDNRKANLRYLTHRDNISRGMLNKTSKYTGVHWDLDKSKWRAHLRIKGKGFSLGCFDNEEDAFESYSKALEEFLKTGNPPTKIKRSKDVLDTATGIVYSSLKEASTALNIEYKLLSAYLTDVKKNKTTLIYK